MQFLRVVRQFLLEPLDIRLTVFLLQRPNFRFVKQVVEVFLLLDHAVQVSNAVFVSLFLVLYTASAAVAVAETGRFHVPAVFLHGEINVDCCAVRHLSPYAHLHSSLIIFVPSRNRSLR